MYPKTHSLLKTASKTFLKNNTGIDKVTNGLFSICCKKRINKKVVMSGIRTATLVESIWYSYSLVIINPLLLMY